MLLLREQKVTHTFWFEHFCIQISAVNRHCFCLFVFFFLFRDWEKILKRDYHSQIRFFPWICVYCPVSDLASFLERPFCMAHIFCFALLYSILGTYYQQKKLLYFYFILTSSVQLTYFSYSTEVPFYDNFRLYFNISISKMSVRT